MTSKTKRKKKWCENSNGSSEKRTVVKKWTPLGDVAGGFGSMCIERLLLVRCQSSACSVAEWLRREPMTGNGLQFKFSLKK